MLHIRTMILLTLFAFESASEEMHKLEQERKKDFLWWNTIFLCLGTSNVPMATFYVYNTIYYKQNRIFGNDA